MVNIASDKEILIAFAKNAIQKIQELNGIANVLMKEGPRPELFDAIYRTTTIIKDFASTCHQNQIVNFVINTIDSQFDALRLEKRSISDSIKKDIKKNINTLREMVNKLLKETPDENKVNENNNNLYEPEDMSTLLSAIGQLSVWSFHELMNALAKVHGYTEMLDDVLQQLQESNPQAYKEIRTIQEKLITNTSHMTGIINRIRSLRGKTRINIQEHNVRNIIKRIQELTQQPPKTLQWSSLHIPSVNVKFDQIIFEQIWVHLWKLLAEWQAPRTLVQSMCFGEIDKHKSFDIKKFKNILSIYIWLEPNGADKLDPTSLKYTTQTPQPDLANVFHYTSKIAARVNTEITCAKARYGGAVFRISLPCDDAIQAVSETGIDIPQPLHILKLSQTDKPLKNILILDDEKDLRTILSLKINKMGYGVSIASSILEAKQILDKKDIKLIISDIFLQQESGLELLKEIKSIKPNLPFIFITGASEDDLPSPISEILVKYSSAFLTKPISTQLLKETLEKFIPMS